MTALDSGEKVMKLPKLWPRREAPQLALDVGGDACPVAKVDMQLLDQAALGKATQHARVQQHIRCRPRLHGISSRARAGRA